MIFYNFILHFHQNAMNVYDQIGYQSVISMDFDAIDTPSGYVAKDNISEKHVD